MRVLEINAVYGFDSTGVIVKDIIEEVEKNGGKGFCAFLQGEKEENAYKFNNKVDRYYHALYTRIFGKQGYASRYETKKFLKWVDKINPDIVHLHNLHSNYINLNMLLKYLAKKDIATVITLHDCWFFTGKCFHYKESDCMRWQDSCGNCPQKHSPVNSLFFDKSKKVLLDKEKYITAIPRLKIVGCSKWITQECKKSKLKNCDITYVRNGVDTSIFKPTENEFKKNNEITDKFVILGFMNKWREERNQPAAEKILETFNNDAIVLIGCNEADKERFSKYPNVLTLGFIKDRKELADIYSSADVFINLTHQDTLPTVNMESICSGTPVITYNVTGSPELVDKGSGYIVKEDDVKSLISKIKKIKKDGFFIDIEKYQKKYDKNTNYKKYIKIFKELSNKK